MDSEVRDQLKQALIAIRAGDMETARKILRPLCAANNADAWWLAAQTTQDPKQIRIALEKALEIEPGHEHAARQLAEMLDAPPESAPPRKAQKKASSAGSTGFTPLRLLIVILGGIAVAGLIMVFYRALTYSVPPPVLGPYAVRYMAHYKDEAPAPCNSFRVFGTVPDGTGLSVRLWDRVRFDETVTIDSNNAFQFDMPKARYFFQRKADYHDLGDELVQLQITSVDGVEQSGVSHLWFYGSCALYVEYARDTISGVHIGSAARRPPSWEGPYAIAFSSLTTSPLLICDFTGFTGTAYDDYGPMNDIFVQIRNLSNGETRPHYYITSTGDLEPQLGPSGWALFAEPQYTYLLQVENTSGTIIASDLIYLPEKEGCEKNLIKVSITQSEYRDTPPPALPPTPQAIG